MKLDITFILEKSRAFYKDHELGDWAEAVPRRGELTAAGESRLVWAEKAGWDESFAFPPFPLQMATLSRLVEAMARKPAPDLPDDHQYVEEPFLADGWARAPNGKVLQRDHDLGPRLDGPYLFIFSRKPVLNAWGRSGKQIADLLGSKNWQGLTVPEYLVLQRGLCERNRNHRFLDTEDEPRGHLLWLVDSASEQAMTIAGSNQRGIQILACPLGHRDARRATVAGMVFPIQSMDRP